MPQVAARINDQQERWLKDYFRTKSAGAEFILPWAVDTFFRAINGIKSRFSSSELKTIIDAYRDTKLQPEHTRQSYLILQVANACETTHVHIRHNVNKSVLEGKIRQLNDTQATALMIWASAFWVSRNCSADSLDEYIKIY